MTVISRNRTPCFSAQAMLPTQGKTSGSPSRNIWNPNQKDDTSIQFRKVLGEISEMELDLTSYLMSNPRFLPTREWANATIL